MEKIIACISTPLGKGAISIVRMSGENCLEVAKKVFFSKSLNYENIKPRYMYLGDFSFDENLKEKCMMVYFKAPNSYTGEDLIEFQIHGGIIVTQKVYEKLLDCGAFPAEPGEISKRAFLNGKLSLDSAEAIVDEINAESESELKASLILASGKLFEQVTSMQTNLTELLADIEVTLDYPEHDIEETVKEKIYNNIKEIKSELDKHIENSKQARFIKNGINVAIIGRANVGKSSLLNALLGEERAIVTDIEGTTRDNINEHFFYNGIKINLTDTAGIRESKDIVENLGIERSKKAIENSDMIIFVVDASEKLSNEDLEIKKLLENKIFITVINKSDKERKVEKLENEISISALENKNIDYLKEVIFSSIIKNQINFNEIILTNERQLNELKTCYNTVLELENAREFSLDVISMLLKQLWNNLGKITGNTENENIIDLIFSKFCLGK